MGTQKPINKETGFDINEEFSRFDQRNEVYCRSEWDAEVKSKRATEFFKGHYMPNARARKAGPSPTHSNHLKTRQLT